MAEATEFVIRSSASGRYTRLCGVLPLRSLKFDDKLHYYQSSAEDIQRNRYAIHRRHNSTESTPEHHFHIPNHEVEYNADFDSEIPSYRVTDVWWQSSLEGGYTSLYDTKWSCLMTLVASGATSFRREVWPYPNQPQPLPHAITVPEVLSGTKAKCTHRQEDYWQ